MKKHLLLSILLLTVVIVFGQKIPFQGKLIESGAPIDGTRTLEFSIASPAWSETHTDVPITDGLYFVVLGSINPLPNNLFSENDEQSLDISVDGTDLSSVLLIKPLLPPLNVKNNANVQVAAIVVKDETQNGELIINGSNGNPNVSMLGYGPEGNRGSISIHDENGDTKANMFSYNNVGAFSILGKTGGSLQGRFQTWNAATENLPALYFDGNTKNNVYISVNNGGGTESGQIGIQSTADEAMVLTPYSIWIKRSAADNNGSQGTYAQVLAENWSENGTAGFIGVSGPTTNNISIGAQNDNRDLPQMTLTGTEGHESVQIGCTDDSEENGFIIFRNKQTLDEMSFTSNAIGGNTVLNIWNGINVGNGAQISGTLNLNGDFTGSGTQYYSSDRRLKTNIQPLGINTIQKIQLIKGVSYNWRQDEFPDKNFSSDKQIGLIAQELEAQFPELVKTNKDGYKSVNYNGFTAVLLEAVKELNAKVERLEKVNMQLKADLSSTQNYTSEMAQLKDQMEVLVNMVQKQNSNNFKSHEPVSTPGLK